MQNRTDKIVPMPMDAHSALRISVSMLEKEAQMLQNNFEIYTQGFKDGQHEYEQAYKRERSVRRTMTWVAFIMTAIAILGAII